MESSVILPGSDVPISLNSRLIRDIKLNDWIEVVEYVTAWRILDLRGGRVMNSEDMENQNRPESKLVLGLQKLGLNPAESITKILPDFEKWQEVVREGEQLGRVNRAEVDSFRSNERKG